VNIPKQIYIAMVAIIILITVIAVTTMYNPVRETPGFTEEIEEDKTNTTPNAPTERTLGGSTGNRINDITSGYIIEPNIYIYREREYPEIIVEIKITSDKNTAVTIKSVIIDDLTPEHPLYGNLTFTCSDIQVCTVAYGHSMIISLNAKIMDETLLSQWDVGTRHKVKIYLLINYSREEQVEYTVTVKETKYKPTRTSIIERT